MQHNAMQCNATQCNKQHNAMQYGAVCSVTYGPQPLASSVLRLQSPREGAGTSVGFFFGRGRGCEKAMSCALWQVRPQEQGIRHLCSYQPKSQEDKHAPSRIGTPRGD